MPQLCSLCMDREAILILKRTCFSSLKPEEITMTAYDAIVFHLALLCYITRKTIEYLADLQLLMSKYLLMYSHSFDCN